MASPMRSWLPTRLAEIPPGCPSSGDEGGLDGVTTLTRRACGESSSATVVAASGWFHGECDLIQGQTARTFRRYTAPIRGEAE